MEGKTPFSYYLYQLYIRGVRPLKKYMGTKMAELMILMKNITVQMYFFRKDRQK
jgi:hypothetical protein